MKKIINGIITVVMLLAFSISTGTVQMAKAQEEASIAIIQLVSHPSLDDITEGIYEGLEARGYVEGENLTVDFQNAEGDINLLSTISQQVVSNQPDLIIAIATPTAQSVQNVTSDIPIIMSAITDPIAAGLIDDLEQPGANMTGVSDKVSYDDQFELILEIYPELENIGMIYTTSEDNSEAEIEQAAAVAETYGLNVTIEGIASTLDMQLVAENLASQVDAIFVGSDNTIASAFENLVNVTDQAGIPVFTTVDTFVAQGALSAVAINQKDTGLLTAEVAADVLEGAETKDYPVRFLEDLQPVVNFETAERLGIELSDELTDKLVDITERISEE